MSLALDDLPRDPEWLLRQLQQMAEVVVTERSRNTVLEIERDTVLAERDALRAEHDAAQAEIEKLRLLIRQLAGWAVRPPLGAARPRPAPAGPGRPRADRCGGRGGAG